MFKKKTGKNTRQKWKNPSWNQLFMECYLKTFIHLQISHQDFQFIIYLEFDSSKPTNDHLELYKLKDSRVRREPQTRWLVSPARWLITRISCHFPVSWETAAQGPSVSRTETAPPPDVGPPCDLSLCGKHAAQPLIFPPCPGNQWHRKITIYWRFLPEFELFKKFLKKVT